MLRKPEWIKRKIYKTDNFQYTEELLENLSLNTVCREANCPNRGECFSKKTATFMILGDICTRNCRFCAVTKGIPGNVYDMEPENIAIACKKLKLRHVVITSVTRDDLDDGGAMHYFNVVNEVRKMNPDITVELLIPDMKGNENHIETIIFSKPDILNHNIETVEELYPEIRPEADYKRSLELLSHVKKIDSSIYTKSGIMLGFGEEHKSIIRTMEDLRKYQCDILTIGQYLQPSKHHAELKEYITPEMFEEYKKIAEDLGFKYISSGPFVRSSYNAEFGMEKLGG